MNFLELPIFVAVIDSIVDIEISINIINNLYLLSEEFEDKVSFTWVEGNFNKEKKKLLGIKGDQLPGFAFFRLDYDSKIAFP